MTLYSNAELASVVRSVNAEHARAGGPELPALKEAWVRLQRDLHLAEVSGDDAAACRIIRRYGREARAAIAEDIERQARRTEGRQA
jgi:hypothetical protein